jgi:hypothetical protein
MSTPPNTTALCINISSCLYILSDVTFLCQCIVRAVLGALIVSYHICISHVGKLASHVGSPNEGILYATYVDSPYERQLSNPVLGILHEESILVNNNSCLMSQHENCTFLLDIFLNMFLKLGKGTEKSVLLLFRFLNWISLLYTVPVVCVSIKVQMLALLLKR